MKSSGYPHTIHVMSRCIILLLYIFCTLHTHVQYVFEWYLVDYNFNVLTAFELTKTKYFKFMHTKIIHVQNFDDEQY